MELNHKCWRIRHKNRKIRPRSFEVLIYKGVLELVYIEPRRPYVGRKKKGDERSMDGIYRPVGRPGRSVHGALRDNEIGDVVYLKTSIYHRNVVTTTAV